MLGGALLGAILYMDVALGARSVHFCCPSNESIEASKSCQVVIENLT